MATPTRQRLQSISQFSDYDVSEPTEEVDNAAPPMEGYLHKMKAGGNRSFSSSWVKRYFKVEFCKPSSEEEKTWCLNYYKSQTSSAPSAKLSLWGIDLSKPFRDGTRKQNVCFIVDSKNRTFLLRAHSSVEMEAWVLGLNEYIQDGPAPLLKLMNPRSKRPVISRPTSSQPRGERRRERESEGLFVTDRSMSPPAIPPKRSTPLPQKQRGYYAKEGAPELTRTDTREPPAIPSRRTPSRVNSNTHTQPQYERHESLRAANKLLDLDEDLRYDNDKPKLPSRSASSHLSHGSNYDRPVRATSILDNFDADDSRRASVLDRVGSNDTVRARGRSRSRSPPRKDESRRSVLSKINDSDRPRALRPSTDTSRQSVMERLNEGPGRDTSERSKSRSRSRSPERNENSRFKRDSALDTDDEAFFSSSGGGREDNVRSVHERQVSTQFISRDGRPKFTSTQLNQDTSKAAFGSDDEEDAFSIPRNYDSDRDNRPRNNNNSTRDRDSPPARESSVNSRGFRKDEDEDDLNLNWDDDDDFFN
jgi:hypothetical protein